MVVVSSLGPPEEGIVLKEANVTTYLNEKSLGKGTLHISESRVTWVSDRPAAAAAVGGSAPGAQQHTFSLEYNHIALHAISRDLAVFPGKECLYLMIDTKLVESAPPTPRSTPETSDSEDDDGEGMTEIRFAPEDKTKLQEMFNAMSQCQKLHPDPEAAEDAEDEEDEEGDEDNADNEDMYEDADEAGDGNGVEESAMDES